jgi:aerobic-type carbon monoxide dehydrogenase small subunit (CoxS/CutS family)
MTSALRPVEALEIELTINGDRLRRVVPVRRLLSDFIREDVGLTGTHIGCEQGVCGACTILVNGLSARSCIMLAVQADGADIITVEGIAPPQGLNRMQRAFKHHRAVQCGFCTAGILMTLEAADPRDYPDEPSIRELLTGNLCRCTGYQNIVAAVMDAWSKDDA